VTAIPQEARAVLERRVLAALDQMRRDIPPIQFRTEAARREAEGKCVAAVLAAVAAVWPGDPPKRDPASTTGGEFTRGPLPRLPHRKPAFGLGRDPMHEASGGPENPLVTAKWEAAKEDGFHDHRQAELGGSP
jgi:hypothetical protein